MTSMKKIFVLTEATGHNGDGGFQYRNFHAWKADALNGAEKICGPNFMETINSFIAGQKHTSRSRRNTDATGSPVSDNWVKSVGLPALYKGNYTENEAAHEMFFWFDVANNTNTGDFTDGVEGYLRNGVFNIHPQMNIDFHGDDNDTPRDASTWDSFTKEDAGRGPKKPFAPPAPIRRQR